MPMLEKYRHYFDIDPDYLRIQSLFLNANKSCACGLKVPMAQVNHTLFTH